MEFINNIWIWIGSAIGGISLAGIIAAIVYGCLKGAFNRTISKINLEKTSETIANKQMERIKKVSFSQNIQPIVESELRKITDAANEYIKKELDETQKRYDNVINILEKFYAYFDDSLVSESKKQELKKALEEAKSEVPVSNEIQIKEIVVEEPKKKKNHVELISVSSNNSIEKPSNYSSIER